MNNNTPKPRLFKSNNTKHGSDDTTEQRPYLPIRFKSAGSGRDTQIHKYIYIYIETTFST